MSQKSGNHFHGTNVSRLMHWNYISAALSHRLNDRRIAQIQTMSEVISVISDEWILNNEICTKNFNRMCFALPTTTVLKTCHIISVYSETSNISCTLVGNKMGDHIDAVGAPPVGAAPITSSRLHAWLLRDWAKTTARLDEKHLSLGDFVHLVLTVWRYIWNVPVIIIDEYC